MNYLFGVSSAFGKCQINKSDSYLFEVFNDGIKDYVCLSISDGKGKVKEGVEVSNWAVNFLKNEIKELITKQTFNFNEVKDIYYKMNLLIKDYANELNSSIYTSLLTIFLDGDYIHIINVGSSRAYLIHENKISKLIEEKNFNAEEKGSVNDSVGKLGNCNEKSITYQSFKMPKSSCLLLCTDGVYKAVNNIKMYALIKNSNNAQESAEKIVKYAKNISGIDDMTALVFSYDGKSVFRNKFLHSNNIPVWLIIALFVILGSFAILNVKKHKQRKERKVFDERLAYEKGVVDKYSINIKQHKGEKTNLSLKNAEVFLPKKQVHQEEARQSKKGKLNLKVIDNSDIGYIKYTKEEVDEKVENPKMVIEKDIPYKRTLDENLVSDKRNILTQNDKRIGVLIVNTLENDCQVKVFEGFSLISINRSGEKISLPLNKDYKIEVSKDGKFIGEQDIKLDSIFKIIDIGIK